MLKYSRRTKSEKVHVVRKRLRPARSREEYDRVYLREQTCLRLLNQLRHPNIIRLLGSYTHQKQHYFLFPFIQTNLQKFLLKEERLGEFKHDFTFFAALRGLASALSHAHALRLRQDQHGLDFEAVGYHHDLRPANVLVSGETFLLADFGLGNLKSIEMESQTPWKPTTGDYLAPECMDDKNRIQHVARPIDTWAFGCLMADVVTYMHKGVRGVREFSDKRLAPGRVPHWEESVFYDNDGNLKEVAVSWLRDLTGSHRQGYDEDPQNSLSAALVALCLKTLVQVPSERPTMDQVCRHLTGLSFRAHFEAVRDKFGEISSARRDSALQRHGLNLWMPETRVSALGRALSIDHAGKEEAQIRFLDTVYDSSIRHLSVMFHTLGQILLLVAQPGGACTTSDTEFDRGLRATLCDKVNENLSDLWDGLPSHTQTKAEDYWRQDLLRTESEDDLLEIHKALQSTEQPMIEATRALAWMKKIQLELARAENLEGGEGEAGQDKSTWVVPASDVHIRPAPSSDRYPHTIGTFRGSAVLVEWMWYKPSWERLDPSQRSLVMNLRAESLGNSDRRSQGLSALKCLGFFEKVAPAPGSSGGRFGYGFVYEIPPRMSSPPLTLLQLLLAGMQKQQGASQDYDQPLLGQKFKLAFALAEFMMEFHTIGWLHGNFNSNNILLQRSEPAGEEGDGDNKAQPLDQPPTPMRPFVVGLHKSRPDGSRWETEGPGTDGDPEEYQHPEYRRTGRYRQTYDYYGLGVVLLEIGLWRPLERGLLASDRFRTTGAAEIRNELVKLGEKRLGARMGRVYRDVVVCCLSGRGFDEDKDAAGSSTSRTATLGRFIDAVVEPLRGLRVVFERETWNGEGWIGLGYLGGLDSTKGSHFGHDIVQR